MIDQLFSAIFNEDHEIINQFLSMLKQWETRNFPELKISLRL